MAERLDRSADPEMAAPELVLETAVGAFGGGAGLVVLIIGIGNVDETAPGSFRREFYLQRGVAPGVEVDDRNPAGGQALRDDEFGITGGIHDVVEPDHALLAQPHQRDGGLAVMGRGGGEHGGDRYHGVAD